MRQQRLSSIAIDNKTKQGRATAKKLKRLDKREYTRECKNNLAVQLQSSNNAMSALYCSQCEKF
ncbi:Hypothetical predicted protein [Paramuricea clavata]|uniref:Uncharacterized protein n=1 Tax=Paramuricea clavata TaxID=317549 RepID=A0A7D9DR12_PARCT|nr:Hypothetical predicted protein [Paramuricea clavata]